MGIVSGLIWYIILACIGVLSVIYTINRKRHIYKVSDMIALYLFSSCITSVSELLVILFGAYSYKLRVSSDPWTENIIGHLLGNLAVYPSAVVIMVTHKLRYIGKLFIVAFLVLIEFLFVNLRIYEQHWWKYYMTAIAAFVLLIFIEKVFNKMEHKQSRLARAIFFLCIAQMILHLPLTLLLVFEKQYYHISFVENLYGGSINASSKSLTFLYNFFEAFMLIFFVYICNKKIWKPTVYAISITVQCLLAIMNILIFNNGWNLLYLILVYTGSITAFILLEGRALKPSISDMKLRQAKY